MEPVKDTNPKDTLGNGRLPLGLVPDSGIAIASLAFLEGASKYGRFNWRIAGVRASIYHDAMRRHLAKWFNGEDCDAKTEVPHLASVIASAMILIDAELCDKLTDDRPPFAPVSGLVDGLQPLIAHLKELFKDHNPYQFTRADNAEPRTEPYIDPTDEAIVIAEDSIEPEPVHVKATGEEKTFQVGQRLRDTSFGSGIEGPVVVISVEEYLNKTGRKTPPHVEGFPYVVEETNGYGWGIASNFELIS